MSKIQGKPFIQSVVDSLTDELKKDLLDLMNGDEQTPVFRSMINKNALITAGTDKNKVQFVFLETWNKNYTGYLIYNNSYCVLVGFNANTQDMSILNIDVAKQTCNLVKQPLSILELRFCLQDAADHINASEIDSGSATADQVLAADGDGGAEWKNVMDVITPETVETGDAVQLFGFDSQGNLVKDEMPEGITVDETVIEDSPNAVAGGAVYDAIADAQSAAEAKTDALQEGLENGTVVPNKSQTANDLEPVSSESGSEQETPFINQGTATNNNDANAEVDTGITGKQLEKQGNTICKNQWFDKSNFGATDTINGITFTNNNDGTISVSGTATDTASYSLGSVNLNGKRYLLSGSPSSSTDNNYFLYDAYNGNKANANGKISVFRSGGGSVTFTIRVTNGTAISGVVVFKPQLVCIDQWFNDDVPQDLLDHPEHWSWHQNYGDYIAYNTGTLVNSDGRYLECGQSWNVWDEQWESGTIAWRTGAKENDGTRIRSKNPIEIIPNRDYYFKTNGVSFTACWYDKDNNFIKTDYPVDSSLAYAIKKSPSNAKYLMFSPYATYGTTYNNDITISLYYEGEDYSQYIPYKAPKVYDTGTEELRKAGSVKDTKAPDGTIHRLVGVVDLSTLSWTEYISGAWYSDGIKNDILKQADLDTLPYIISNKYTRVTRRALENEGDIAIEPSTNANAGRIRIISSSSPTGTLYYGLAIQTTEQGTSFAENIEINDMSYMAWYSAYTDENTNTLVSIPQGCKIFYPAWYVGFLDSLGQRNDIDWASEQIVSQEQLSADKTELQGVDTQLLNAIGGTLRHCLAIQESELDFEDTDFVDLGSLSWSTYSSGTNVLRTATISGAKNGVSGSVPKLLSTKYGVGTSATISSLSSTLANKTLSLVKDSNILALRDDELTDTANLKGILLAYEKASE